MDAVRNDTLLIYSLMRYKHHRTPNCPHSFKLLYLYNYVSRSIVLCRWPSGAVSLPGIARAKPLARPPSSRPAAHRNRGSSHTAAGQQRAAPPLKLLPFVRRTPRDRRRRFTVFRRSPSPLGPSAADRLPAPAKRRSRPAASPAQITFASTSSPAVVSAFAPPPPPPTPVGPIAHLAVRRTAFSAHTSPLPARRSCVAGRRSSDADHHRECVVTRSAAVQVSV